MIYLDNAATSWPKPAEVLKAMVDVLERAGGNPGRSGHRLSIGAARVMYEAREGVARLFNSDNPLRVIFTGNATHALNLAIAGLLRPGDNVVTSSMEHNAVMRPLRHLEKQGLRLSVVAGAADGSLDVSHIARAVNGNTRLVVMNHGSNVVGTLLPVAETAAIAHRAGAWLLVDAAQTAGVIPIDIRAMGIDLLAFTGHKGLQGPPGSGGLVIGDNFDAALIQPLLRGGTGSRSEFEEQPDELPDKFESGTPNIVGIAGLLAGIRWLGDRGIEAIRAREQELAQALISGLSVIRGVRVHGTGDTGRSIAVISFSVAGKSVSDVGLMLDEEFGVLSRIGLHCAPAAHRTIGTFPEGTVRLAPGFFTTTAEIETALRAVEKVVRA